MKTTSTVILAAVLVILASGSMAQNYKIDWHSINSGGVTAAAGSFAISSSVGQPAVGFVSGTSLLHWVGFWAGDVPVPTVVATTRAAKMLPNGTLVSVAGKIATSAIGDFAEFFYVEDPGRFGGIRVAAPPSSVPELARGSVVNVIGRMSTTPDDERQICGPIVIVTSTAVPLLPVAMVNRALGGRSIGIPPDGQMGVTGGFGLNNVGLLVQVWGKVTATGQGFVELDDGSGPVRIDTSLLASPPGEGTYITVIGISSLYKTELDHLKLLLPRGNEDISP